MRPVSRGLAALALAVLVAACGSGGVKEDPLFDLSAEEALAEGKALLEAEKYRQAQDYLTHAYEVEPNSPSGREALLLAADAYFQNGGEDNFIRAEGKYRDFLNRFPTSERSAYAQFQVARSLVERMRKPDRDQAASREALQALEEVLLLYPTSEYAAAAQEEIARVRQSLAEAEFRVGRFYFKIGLQKAAVARFERLRDEYPEYMEMDKVLYFLGRANRRWKKPDEARAAFDLLQREYPDSPYVSKVPEIEEAE